MISGKRVTHSVLVEVPNKVVVKSEEIVLGSEVADELARKSSARRHAMIASAQT